MNRIKCVLGERRQVIIQAQKEIKSLYAAQKKKERAEANIQKFYEQQAKEEQTIQANKE